MTARGGHRRDKESVKRRTVSLDGPSTEGASGTAPAAMRVPDDHHATRTGGVAHDSIAAIEDREAYELALESMPEDLRALCERVATQTQSQIVDELHIGKRTIRKKLREARVYFENAGIENSRFFGSRTSADGICNGVSRRVSKRRCPRRIRKTRT